MDQEYETTEQTAVEKTLRTVGDRVNELMRKSPDGVSSVVAASVRTGKPGEVYSFVSATGEDVARAIMAMLMSEQFVSSGLTEAIIETLLAIRGNSAFENIEPSQLN